MFSNNADTILRDVFEKYSRDNRLTLEQFCKMMTKLSKHIDILHQISNTRYSALFALIDKKSVGYLTYQEFIYWWTSTNKLSYVIGRNGKYLEKIYNMFNIYQTNGLININNLEELLRTLDVTNTDQALEQIDTNLDGQTSFYELCKWLKWFEIYF